VQQVTAVLEPLGFRVKFHMAADDKQAYLQLAPLPEQCHYDGPSSMSVVYLAGRDPDPTVDDDEDAPDAVPLVPVVFPPHASRFWFYCGHESAEAFQRTLETLAVAFSLTWEPLVAPVAQITSLPSPVVPVAVRAAA
jgi:hypothetical protein